MRICLVATFPPSGRQLNEYAFHIARELQSIPGVELIVLADELEEYDFATDENGNAAAVDQLSELEAFTVIRCWRFGSLTTPLRLLNTIRKLKPDVVWFNLVFSSFATPERPLAAFAGLCAPALTRAAGFFTHVTLHHIIEHVDFAVGGARRKKLFRMGADLATRALLRADSVSVLLPAYLRTLNAKYSATNVILFSHGTFTSEPSPPDFTKRGNPDLRILAIGHWGTYKRLETLMEAFPAVLKQIPNARLIVAGANHHTKAGYWESIHAAQPPEAPIEFRGYVAEEDIPELFQTASILVLPYDSATGSSGPAHQACEFAVPIVCADIGDLREMAANEAMAVAFYKIGDAGKLAEQLIAILQSPALQLRMAKQNFAAGARMAMSGVVRSYLRRFEVLKCKEAIRNAGLFEEFPRPDPLAQQGREKAFDRGLQDASFAQDRNGGDERMGSEESGAYASAKDFGDSAG